MTDVGAVVSFLSCLLFLRPAGPGQETPLCPPLDDLLEVLEYWIRTCFVSRLPALSPVRTRFVLS